ncbi:hypothetical protein [Streptomyces prunicolor]|uniref:hypothetical protein n=1 Tax=Streptomyces prunicolor TaxID=67348 RepID=UPI0033E3C22D
MQSELLIAVVGLAGTALGAGLGVLGVVLAARLANRAQFDGQMAQARREAFHSCAQALIIRQTALKEHLDLLSNVANAEEDGLDPRTRHAQWQSYCQQKENFARLNASALQALGAVAVVGTPHVWRQATATSERAEVVYERLEAWFRSFRGEENWVGGPVDRSTYRQFNRMLDEHNNALHAFLDACNATLSPTPRRRLRSVPRQPAISPMPWRIARQ